MIVTFLKASKIIRQEKSKGKTVGLITGCFDIVHNEHIDLFHFARRYVDFLVIGIEGDDYLRLFKGKNRPVNSIKNRIKVVNELKSVDLVFEIKYNKSDFDEEYLDHIHVQILKRLSPNYLISAINADAFWEKKKRRAKKCGVKVIGSRAKKVNSSTRILELTSSP